jgi:hypothetical protein
MEWTRKPGRNGADALFGLANLPSRRTGLPFVVWISPRGAARHDLRVKVSPGPRALPSEMISVAVRPKVRAVDGQLDSRQMALLTRWIDLNREVLQKFWDGEIEYTEEAIELIRPIDLTR